MEEELLPRRYKRRMTHRQRKERVWAGVAKRRMREHMLRDHDTDRGMIRHLIYGLALYKTECGYCGHEIACPVPAIWAEFALLKGMELPDVCLSDLRERDDWQYYRDAYESRRAEIARCRDMEERLHNHDRVTV